MTEIIDPENPLAPFGYDGDTPIAPFGHKADGNPRLRPGGRRAGPQTATKAAAPKRSTSTKSVKAPAAPVDYRKSALGMVALGTVPYQLLGSDPMRLVSRFLGAKQVMACKGNAVIINMFAEPLADCIAEMATVNPALAARLERGTVPLPYLTAIKTLTDLTAALIQNHARPNPELAETSDRMIAFESAQIRQQIDAMQAEQRLAAAEQREAERHEMADAA